MNVALQGTEKGLKANPQQSNKIFIPTTAILTAVIFLQNTTKVHHLPAP